MAQPQEFEDRLNELEHKLADVTRRLRVLEDGQHTAVTTAFNADTAPLAPPDTVFLPARHADSTRDTSDLAGLATLLGRTCIVFGGAYLLRALTETGRLPGTAGVIIGLTYSLAFLVAAELAARTHKLSAQFHGVSAMLIGLPIVWEATSQFHLLSPAFGALFLGAGAAAAFVIAGRGELDAVAGVAGFGTMATALATAFSAANYGPFSLLLVALSAATYWLSDRPRHAWLRWPNAVAAGLGVVAVTARAVAVPPSETIGLALTAQALLLATMLGSIGVRTVIFGRNVRIFDVMQALSALIIGVGGAAYLARTSPAGLTMIGALTAILASGAYMAAFFRLADRPHLAASYHAFAAFGLVAATAALALLFHGPALALASVTLAVLTIAYGQQRLAGYASLHGSAYVMTALAASGILGSAITVWTMTPAPWPRVTLVGWVALAATGACTRIRFSRKGEIGDILAIAGRIITAGAFVLSLGGAALMLIGPLIAGVEANPGILASLRTVLLSIAVVGLGLMANVPNSKAFTRLIYPVLAIGGVRFVLDDFRHSRPSTLFIALACFGLALVFGPRFASKPRTDA